MFRISAPALARECVNTTRAPNSLYIGPCREDRMPLSDSERRRLEALAQDFISEDP